MSQELIQELQAHIQRLQEELASFQQRNRILEDENERRRRDWDVLYLKQKDTDNLMQQIVHLSTYVKKVESHLHESQNDAEELRVLCAWCTVCKKQRASFTNGKRKFYCYKHKPKAKHDGTASKKAT
jgi:predicted ribosome quality control (RQC) complex YloA/Tae2 family protein